MNEVFPVQKMFCAKMDYRRQAEEMARFNGDECEAEFWAFVRKPTNPSVLEKMLDVLNDAQRTVAKLRVIESPIFLQKFVRERIGLSQGMVTAIQQEAVRKMKGVFAGEYASQFRDGDMLAFPLTILGLSSRTENLLYKIRSVGHLITFSAEDLLDFYMFGEGCLKEVRQKLAERGLQLRGDRRKFSEG